MLTYYQWGPSKFRWGQYHINCSRYSLLKYVKKYPWIISKGPMSSSYQILYFVLQNSTPMQIWYMWVVCCILNIADMNLSNVRLHRGQHPSWRDYFTKNIDVSFTQSDPMVLKLKASFLKYGINKGPIIAKRLEAENLAHNSLCRITNGHIIYSYIYIHIYLLHPYGSLQRMGQNGQYAGRH